MATRLRVLLSPSRLTGLLLAVTVVFLIGLLLGLPAVADPTEPAQPRWAGHGSGSRQLPVSQERLAGEPIRVPLAAAGWTTILSESFEDTWPSGRWQTFDNDDPPSTNGEYYWANRCVGHNSGRSAWSVGRGADGSSLTCGTTYPC